ncbi:uncharacterized protein THITE_2112764 [Thermothielavioides terrestris NRRL 8126]|uniref:Transcription factor domain-containing protein n=1 Tax=Thermothielavioides terrestris (strain ATCC 38088 / NRRL 8126) TaxID=578455 RepID=G2R0E8_THETT|nr:uncharacterized protein THITE_2112764 [Thermothielavioides terrestris NRRL 8126]AEO65613.1 hypothetical protein THITE_2112764 [Thermothielavioides terrestris NRRL 8126]
MPELYLLLMKMSLADETPSALAARHAIAGLSYQHLGQHKTAAMHQTKSLRALQTVIGRLAAGDLEATQALRAMAASMLLNIFETLNFDRSPLHWTIFFCGCKKILNLFHVPHTTYEGDPALILDWIFYHDTLYKFSERHWYPRHPRLVQLAKQEKIISKAKLSPMRHIILPITGCSLHLLVLLSQIVDAVHDRTDPRHLSPSHLATIHSLEQQLSALTQLPSNRISAALNADDNKHAHEPAAGLPPEESAETRQAELYRLAAHIYLLRVARAAPPTDPTVLALVDKALDLLRRSSPGCSRPWPLFVVALEARTDAQRRVVSDALRDGLARRPLGNLQIVRRMVHAAWVQIDLHAESGTGEDVMGVYNTVVSGLRVPPSFT